jgi:hypothetical protein
MGGLELLKKHPISSKLIKDWFMEKMIESLNDASITEEFREFMREQSIDDDKIGILIDANPRMLFDVFDDNDIIIENFLYPDGTFTIKIGNQATTQSWKTRKEAEAFAIEAAFEILEETLSEARMKIIAQNGNTGEHYEKTIEE